MASMLKSVIATSTMSISKLNVWSNLNRAFLAPFRLAPHSWATLAKPLGAIAALAILAYVANLHFPGSVVAESIGVPLLAAIAWFVYTMMREFLQSTTADTIKPASWRTFVQFLIGAAIVIAIFALVSSIALYAILPLTLYFAFSVASETPLLAFGSLGMYGLSILAGAYPAARLIAVVPALSIGEVSAANQVWTRTSKNGIRLLFVVFVPVATQGYVEYALVFNSPSVVKFAAAFLITSYVFLVQIASISYLYTNLYSDEPPEHPAIDGRTVPSWAAVAGVFAIVVVSSLLVQIDTSDNETTAASNDRFDSSSSAGPFSTSFQDTFLTSSKESITLTATSEWDVSDDDRFRLATGGSVRHADMRIKDMTRVVVRNTLSKQAFTDTNLVFDAPNGEVLRQMNDYSEELGVSVVRIALQPPQNRQ